MTGNGPPDRHRGELHARNLALHAAYGAGRSTRELANEYGLSHTRVRRIITETQERRNQETRLAQDPDLISPLQVGRQAQAAMRMVGISRWSRLADMDERSLMRIPRIGPTLAARILAARASR
jgi:hypothetical protein